MKHFRVVFKEKNMPFQVERDCYVESEEKVIELYGLREPEIENFTIEEIKTK
jgi:hypothetical protein